MHLRKMGIELHNVDFLDREKNKTVACKKEINRRQIVM